MMQVAESFDPSIELSRFFIVAEVYKNTTGRQALMPACFVDTEWHRMLKDPDQYQTFCHDSVGRTVLHEPIKGEGEIEWVNTYEMLYGRLPDLWFRDANGILNAAQRDQYLEKRIFYAAWDCTPY